MNQFHELNILTSRGDLKSAFLLIKSYSEGVARKIMKKAGYYVPDVKGSTFWGYRVAQGNFPPALPRNRT